MRFISFIYRHFALALMSVSSFLLLCGCQSDPGSVLPAAEKTVARLHDPDTDYVLVACHRGDWRNYPENSLEGIRSVIDMGADIVEIDVAMTSDSVLVLCHDRTLDRTTNLRGYVKDTPYHGVIDKGHLKTGHDVVTKYRIPTLEEVLELCKDKIVINIDKGYDYYDQIMELLAKTGTADQILIKGTYSPESVASKMSAYSENMMSMPIVDVGSDFGRSLLDSYLKQPEPPIACEVVWNGRMNEKMDSVCNYIRSQGVKIWTDSLWDSLCGGYDDDDAVENADSVYGYHISIGSTIIQTDRPALLLEWLRGKGLHD